MRDVRYVDGRLVLYKDDLVPIVGQILNRNNCTWQDLYYALWLAGILRRDYFSEERYLRHCVGVVYSKKPGRGAELNPADGSLISRRRTLKGLPHVWSGVQGMLAATRGRLTWADLVEEMCHYGVLPVQGSQSLISDPDPARRMLTWRASVTDSLNITIPSISLRARPPRRSLPRVAAFVRLRTGMPTADLFFGPSVLHSRRQHSWMVPDQRA